MLSAVLAVVGPLMLAPRAGVLTLLTAILGMVVLLGALLAVMWRLLADEGDPTTSPPPRAPPRRHAEPCLPTAARATTRIAA
jgi:hypothetical protein